MLKTPRYAAWEQALKVEMAAMMATPNLSYMEVLVARAMEMANQELAQAWTEGFEANASWIEEYSHGDNGPPDPPINPYAPSSEET